MEVELCSHINDLEEHHTKLDSKSAHLSMNHFYNLLQISETYLTTKKGITILLRSVKIGDETLIKDFFNSLSANSMYNRFLQARKQNSPGLIEKFLNINFTKTMIILATITCVGIEKIIGISQYVIDNETKTAEIAIAVSDEYQGKGIGYELIKYLDYLARENRLLGFTAEVSGNNTAMLHIINKVYPRTNKVYSCGICTLKMMFDKRDV